jgi:dihydrofolate reductase
MKIHLIVATDRKGGIARGGNIPWKIPKDMEYFKRTTIGAGRNALIMGRKTWESIPNHPLPDRVNIVVSYQSQFANTQDGDGGGAIWKNSIEEAIFWCTEHDTELDDVFVIGGEQIYNSFMMHYPDVLESIYVTRIDDDYKCDQFFYLDDEDITNLGFFVEDETVVFHDEVAVQFLHFVRG